MSESLLFLRGGDSDKERPTFVNSMVEAVGRWLEGGSFAEAVDSIFCCVCCNRFWSSGRMGCGGRAAGAGGWVVFCGADVLVVAGSAQNSRSGVKLAKIFESEIKMVVL